MAERLTAPARAGRRPRRSRLGRRAAVWTLDPRAIDTRLAAHAHPFPRTLLRYPNAGHFVNVPPLSTLADVRTRGDDAWRATLASLDEVGLAP